MAPPSSVMLASVTPSPGVPAMLSMKSEVATLSWPVVFSTLAMAPPPTSPSPEALLLKLLPVTVRSPLL